MSAFSSNTLTILPYLRKLQTEYTIILASTSPRRREILNLMGIATFDVLASNFQEDLDKKSFPHPADYCLETARRKAEDVVHNLLPKNSDYRNKKLLVISADTIVCLGDILLEKPKDKLDAKRMLSLLNGQSHVVHTAVTIFGGFECDFSEDKEESRKILLKESFIETSTVSFGQLSESDIDAYVETGEGLDKAGSYGIQGIGGQFVEGIQGCFFNVMGLPIHKLSYHLSKIVQEQNEVKG
jgi:septum formation protein